MADGDNPAPRLFAVAAPGLEALTAAELRGLGIAGAVEPGGVSWEGTMHDLYAANLHLRTASRVVLRMGEFTARSFIELERHARRLPWESFVSPGRAVRWRVTCRKRSEEHTSELQSRQYIV